MPTETALARERAKRCEWCAKGIPLIAGAFHMLEDMEEWPDCASPSDSDLYEELAKERDELKSRVKSLQQYAQHEPACDRESDSPGGKICTCGMWDALNADWREISAAQEKNNA